MNFGLGLEVVEGAEGKGLRCAAAAEALLLKIISEGDARIVARVFSVLQWMDVELRLLECAKQAYERLLSCEDDEKFLDDLTDAARQLLYLLEKLPLTTTSVQIYALLLQNEPELHDVATVQLAKIDSPLMQGLVKRITATMMPESHGPFIELVRN